MKTLSKVSERLTSHLLSAPHRLANEGERGDVPGWVLITLMTAGLVTALWKFAQPELVSIFSNAINSVKG